MSDYNNLDAKKLLKVRNILIGVTSGLGATTIVSTALAIYYATRKTEEKTHVVEGTIEGADLIYSSQQATYGISSAKTVKWSISWDEGGVGDISIDENTGVVTTAWNAYGVAIVKAEDSIGNVLTKIVKIHPPYVNSDYVWIHLGNGWAVVSSDDLSTAAQTDIWYMDLNEQIGSMTKEEIKDYDLYIGDNITQIQDNFCEKMTSFNGNIIFSSLSKCTMIGKFFMQDCTSFNKEIKLPETLKVIDDSFLDGCTSFNNGGQEFSLPSKLTMIGEWFMRNCKAFNKSYTIPASITRVGDNFMADCDAMAGSGLTINCEAESFSAYGDDTLVTAAEQTNPVYIAGEFADDFIARFPNKDTAPFRKLAKAA